MPRRHRPAGAIAFVISTSVLVTLGVVAPARADDYPTWDQVLAAQHDEAKAKAEIATIENVLAGLQSQADALGREAERKNEAYNVARDDLAAASLTATDLRVQLVDAERRAADSSRKAGQLMAQLARAGGGSVTLELIFKANPENLLSSLGTVSKLSEQAAAIYRQASHDANQAKALGAQADIAEKKRAELAVVAQHAHDLAQASADAALAKLADQKAAANTMYAQLATLKGTTATLEAGYQAGLTAAQAAAAQPPPPPTPPIAPNAPPPAPNSSAVATALAFAYAQLGKPYAFAGSGPGSWDCSGLTGASYAAAGVYIGSHHVTSQYYTMASEGRLVALANMVPGDLIFYGDGGSPDSLYHVAMFVGNGLMVEAPYEGVPVRVTGVRYYDVLAYAGRPTP